jgi:hypothetical protein
VDALVEAAGFETLKTAQQPGTKDVWSFRIARRVRK